MKILKNIIGDKSLFSLNRNLKLRDYSLLLSFFVTLMIVSSIQTHVLAYGLDDDSANDLEKKTPEMIKPDAIQKIISPRKQIEHGVPALGILCNDGFKLILKASNGLPACVKPDSIEKLVERGWAESQEWEVHD